jgi:hypothetical protein
MKSGTGRYTPLDGNHRVLTHKDAGHTHIQASIVRPKWEKGSKGHFSTGELE